MKSTHFLLAICLAATAAAQESTRFFKLDFVVREFDDNKMVSAKAYSSFMSTDEKGRGASIRTGNKVPYQTAPNSTNYADVGANIDCQRLQEFNGQLLVRVVAEITSIPAGENAPAMMPVIRQNRWNGDAILPIAKATTLFSSDDMNSKRKMQLELTATPVK